jgi:hypothetical protein
MTNTSAWVIETANQSYWDGHYANSQGFSDKIDDAVLFSRRQDAEIVINWLLREYAFALRSAQHMWVNGTHKD